MKPILSASVFVLLATACGSRFQTIGGSAVQVEAQPEGRAQALEVPQVGNVSAREPTSIPNEVILSPTSLPIPTLPAPVVVYDEPETRVDHEFPADIGVFAEMSNNLATGMAAPDFDARALGGWTFNLSAQRDSYVLVVPTAIGCGDCVFTMSQLVEAYPDYRDNNLKLILLNMYPEDVPESWAGYADAFPELDAIWGVVSSIDFVVDYDIRSLGTILLVDPEGKLVFRSNYPLIADELRQLFELATS